MEVRTVQFGITFDKPVEIHLNDGKYQTGSKFFETLTQKHIHRLLLVKKFQRMKGIFPKVTSESLFYICLINKMTNKQQ